MVACIICMAFLTDSMALDRQLTVKPIACAICITLCLWKLSIPKNITMVFLVGYLICARISLINATNPIEGLYGISLIVLMILTLCIFSGTNHAVALTFVGLVLAVYGLCQGIPWVDRTGLMGNRNPWSQCLVLILPFCIYSYRYMKWASVITSILILTNIFFLNNRTSFLALGVGCLTLALFDKRFRWVFVGCIVGGLVFTGSMASMTQRLEFWTASLGMIKEHPIIGVGISNWPYEIVKYGSLLKTTPDIFRMAYPLRPHNDYLCVASETGLVGLACYLGMIGSSIYYAIKQKNRLALVGMVMFCTIAFFSFPKERPFLAFLFVLYLSLLKFDAVRLKWITIPAVAVMLLVCVHLSLYHSTERRIAKIRLYTRHNQWNKVIAEADKCSRLNPNASDTVPVRWYRGNANLHLGLISEGAKDHELAYADSPNNVFVLDRMGSLFKMTDQDIEANACFDKIESMVPSFEVSR